MFTGIIEAVGEIITCKECSFGKQYSIKCPPFFLTQAKLGGSIAIEGVCLTLTEINDCVASFDVIHETLNCTTLSLFKEGDYINMERSAKFGDEIGGHLLSGHVFGVATLTRINNNERSFLIPHDWIKYLFRKGYIAIDGISLTLVEVDKENSTFSVHLIPETLARTTLGRKKEGDRVNIEVDAQTLAIVETVESVMREKFS